MLHIHIFVSSPVDVGSERAVTLAVVERIQLEFSGTVQLETYLWERSVLRATETFQGQVLDIKEADLAAFIFWSRMGTPLPDTFRRQDGSRYGSGTEYEFERALEGYAESKKPDVLVYVKTADTRISFRAPEGLYSQVAQLEAVRNFQQKWFRNEDSSFKSAFYEFERTAQFEDLFESHLRKWIRERLRKDTLFTPGALVRKWDGSPFRGLEHFDFKHRLIFFGRTNAVTQVIELLRRRAESGRAILLILGMSGAGKSSLVRAGVLPLLARPRVIEHVLDWRRAVFRPSDEQKGPLASLGAAIIREQALPELASEAVWNEALLQDRTSFSSTIKKVLDRISNEMIHQIPQADREGRVRLTLVIDQFEEIFSDKITEQDRNDFVAVIEDLSRSGDVWVIVTIRADFYSRCAESTAMSWLIEPGGLLVLGPPQASEIAQMIRRPALMAGLSFERREDTDEGLDDVLRDAAAAYPAALPLLEFTLDELWKRSGDSGVLRFSDYDALGGLRGALQQRAEEVFKSLPGTTQAALPTVLAALVRIDPSEEKPIVQSRIPRAQLEGGRDCTALIDAFISARLFVADRAPDGTATIGLAHEALLREWQPATEWIEKNKDILRLRGGIAAAAAFWHAGQESADRLMPEGSLLRNAAKLLSEAHHILMPDDQRFLKASLEEASRLRTRHVMRSLIASTAVTAAIFVLIVGIPELAYQLSRAQNIVEVWGKGDRLPLAHKAAENLRRSIGGLTEEIYHRVPKIGQIPELNAWGVAQMSVAVAGMGATPLITGTKLREFMTSKRSDSCFCWQESEDKFPHTVATAWVLYALATYSLEASEREIDWVLTKQNDAGWWSMFPATNDQENASTTATAWSVLAMHEQLRRNLVLPESKARVASAIRKGLAWLRKTQVPGRARWNEYPFGQAAQIEYFSVSAFVMYVLRQTNPNDLQVTDRLWLDELPRQVPQPRDYELSKGTVRLSAHEFTLDEVRHTQYSWMLVATIDAYPAGTVWQKATAVTWVNRALDRPVMPQEFVGQTWMIPDILLGLRHVSNVGTYINGSPSALRAQ
jgi:hypothetical protein